MLIMEVENTAKGDSLVFTEYRCINFESDSRFYRKIRDTTWFFKQWRTPPKTRVWTIAF